MFDEATGGEISGDASSPLALALDNGSNVVNGTVVAGDIDYVTITIPDGHELAGIDLVAYESGNDRSFIGVQAGTVFTESADAPEVGNLLGYTLFGTATLGTDILPVIGEGQGAQGFTGPLAAGDYTFWIQETGDSPSNYSFDFRVAPVAAAAAPEAPAEDAPAGDAPAGDAPVADGDVSTNVNLEFSGLEPLGEGFVYEGWVIIDGAPVSTGRFVVEADGSLTYLTGSLADDVSAATAVVITIEPAVDPDPGPAAAKPLAGDVVDGVAQLTIGHPAALGDDFSTSGGQFLVATPTTESTDDEYSGVWFLEVTDEGPVAGLDLPVLPEGWVYEGWVVIDGQPVTTGRFLDPAGPDDFGGFSGPLGNPPFPGEDFIVNAPEGLSFPTDLRGQFVVLTVEPADDDSPAPFAMRPLAAQIPADLAVPGSVVLGAGPGVPSGVATLDIPAAAAPEAPAEDAPAEDAPAGDAPAPEAPAEDAPVEDAPEADAPAPAPEAPEADDAPEDEGPLVVEFVNFEFGPRYLEVQPNVNVYSSNQSNTATEFILHPVGDGLYLIQSVSTGLYLHANGEDGNFNVDVVGPVDATAYWRILEFGDAYHIFNEGLGRLLQADRPGFNVDTNREVIDAEDFGLDVEWAIVLVEDE